MQIAHVKNSQSSQNILLTDAWIVMGGNGNKMGDLNHQLSREWKITII